jgi:superfamily II RNA helicase
MSGRAGLRGKDERGIRVIMIDEKALQYYLATIFDFLNKF